MQLLCMLAARHKHDHVLKMTGFMKLAMRIRVGWGPKPPRADQNDNAQAVIEGKPLGAVPVSPEHDPRDVEHDIKLLHSLASQLRAKRSQDGFLGVPSTRLSFELDEQGMPVDCSIYQTAEANSLIEEVSVKTFSASKR